MGFIDLLVACVQPDLGGSQVRLNAGYLLVACSSYFSSVVGKRRSVILNFFEEHGVQKIFKIFEAILPLFQGNMLSFLSAVVEEYLVV